MKRLKIWSIILFAAMTMPLIASCGDDDEKESTSGSGGYSSMTKY